jgi:hypothetical protein
MGKIAKSPGAFSGEIAKQKRLPAKMVAVLPHVRAGFVLFAKQRGVPRHTKSG